MSSKFRVLQPLQVLHLVIKNFYTFQKFLIEINKFSAIYLQMCNDLRIYE